MKFITLILFFINIILFTSCSTNPPAGDTEAEVLFNEIKSNYNGKRYLLALEKISSFRSKYPYSYFITEVELLRADIYYEQGNFLEAVDAYLSFKDFHPNYKRLDIIEWRISESFFKQMPDTVDRDISPAISAITSYQDLIRKYPNSEHVELAKKRVVTLEKMLVEKELYIANFYFKTSDFQSASYRYEKILSTLRGIDGMEKPMLNLIISYIKLKDRDKCLFKIEQFGQFLEKEDRDSVMEKCKKLNKE